MIANNTGREAKSLLETFPGRVGHIYSPDGWRKPWPINALDNGCFVGFDRQRYYAMLERAATALHAPRWAAVPDVVYDRVFTIASWHEHASRVRAFGWPLAFVVQDGMTNADVPADAAVVFVGGSTQWKWETVRSWCAEFPRVHVGRVNTEKLLWQAHRAGAESCDGSGWFRGNRAQLDGLWYYLADSSNPPRRLAHGPHQLRLFSQRAA